MQIIIKHRKNKTIEKDVIKDVIKIYEDEKGTIHFIKKHGGGFFMLLKNLINIEFTKG